MLVQHLPLLQQRYQRCPQTEGLEFCVVIHRQAMDRERNEAALMESGNTGTTNTRPCAERSRSSNIDDHSVESLRS